jgi:hypothetical protein
MVSTIASAKCPAAEFQKQRRLNQLQFHAVELTVIDHAADAGTKRGSSRLHRPAGLLKEKRWRSGNSRPLAIVLSHAAGIQELAKHRRRLPGSALERVI